MTRGVFSTTVLALALLAAAPIAPEPPALAEPEPEPEPPPEPPRVTPPTGATPMALRTTPQRFDNRPAMNTTRGQTRRLRQPAHAAPA